MNSFWTSALAVFALVASADAQQGPPPGGPPPAGMGGAGMPRSAPALQAQSASTTTTETLRVLALANVQKDLGITAMELKGLATVADTLSRTSATEDSALVAVSKVLTAAQATRLQELLVQDMGYNALQLSAVRAQLSLTADQSKAMDAVLASLQTTQRALATSGSSNARQTMTQIQAGTSAALAKLLTTEQDTKLRSLAGRALGSGQG